MESGRFERLMAEHRRYNDALLERHVQITGEQIAAIQTNGEAIQANTQEMRAGFVSLQAEIAALQGEIADQRGQIQAQTEAIWRVLDRLPPSRPQG